MKDKKAYVFGETKGLDKSTEQNYLKPYQSKNQDFCRFCDRALHDKRIKFNNTLACFICYVMWKTYNDSLHSVKEEKEVNYVAS